MTIDDGCVHTYIEECKGKGRGKIDLLYEELVLRGSIILYTYFEDKDSFDRMIDVTGQTSRQQLNWVY